VVVPVQQLAPAEDGLELRPIGSPSSSSPIAPRSPDDRHDLAHMGGLDGERLPRRGNQGTHERDEGETRIYASEVPTCESSQPSTLLHDTSPANDGAGDTNSVGAPFVTHFAS
jgi:hypothetical protein